MTGRRSIAIVILQWFQGLGGSAQPLHCARSENVVNLNLRLPVSDPGDYSLILLIV